MYRQLLLLVVALVVVPCVGAADAVILLKATSKMARVEGQGSFAADLGRAVVGVAFVAYETKTKNASAVSVPFTKNIENFTAILKLVPGNYDCYVMISTKKDPADANEVPAQKESNKINVEVK